MKIQLKERKIICENKHGTHGYFAWPTVGKLQDGRLAMVASGFRMGHLCPFGKGIICYSADEGKTWTLPAVLIDTPLDDRDCGICTFGENGVLITSFNHPISLQRGFDKPSDPLKTKLFNAHFDWLETYPDAEKIVGSTYVISNDKGKTFGEVKTFPVTNPHGPCCLQDGTMLYVGNEIGAKEPGKVLKSYQIQPDGSYECIGSIVADTGTSFWEPHAIQLKSGKIIVHIRVHLNDNGTIFQTESYDGGRTFTKPHQLIGENGCAPTHLMQTKSGLLISTYTYRTLDEHCGIRLMFSKDEGQTWETEIILCEGFVNWDMGYAASVELENGDILTVFYGTDTTEKPNRISQAIWSYSE